ncbi:MAG: hypothetical protein EDM69_02665 [Chlorobiota bacterium]|nr:MAG: hypothetical protein EDM69_02665 [Chlorobiota bacterium]MBV6397952.1 hypothetical protein [Ignavibacteria bacterium]MCE7952526.1 hypothetical protein [Chlorobi bacterium CHB7]
MPYNVPAALRCAGAVPKVRSGGIAQNGLMCEVRDSGKHIRRCEPPERCGERSVADFATSVWGFAFGRVSEHKVSIYY